jgi:hypothetical protein
MVNYFAGMSSCWSMAGTSPFAPHANRVFCLLTGIGQKTKNHLHKAVLAHKKAPSYRARKQSTPSRAGQAMPK